jgi:flagellar basal-body rod protein FlgB
MELSSLHIQGVERSLDALSMRHSAVASNIANINTPGYQKVEVNFEDALIDALNRSTPALASGEAAMMDGMEITYVSQNVMLSWQPVMSKSPAGAQRLDGNKTTVETEMSGMAYNAVKYNALASVVAKEMQLLKSVAQAK